MKYLVLALFLALPVRAAVRLDAQWESPTFPGAATLDVYVDSSTPLTGASLQLFSVYDATLTLKSRTLGDFKYPYYADDQILFPLAHDYAWELGGDTDPSLTPLPPGRHLLGKFGMTLSTAPGYPQPPLILLVWVEGQGYYRSTESVPTPYDEWAVAEIPVVATLGEVTLNPEPDCLMFLAATFLMMRRSLSRACSR